MLEILIGACAGAVITGIFTVVVWVLNRKAAKEDRQHTEDREDDKNDAIALEERLKRLETLMEALIIAERRSYYDRLKSLGKGYIARGEITTDELEDYMAMHEIYHGPLEGNGFLSSLVKAVQRLKKV